jgi:hypothetical protein
MRGGWEPSDLTRGGPGDKGVLDFIVPLDVHRDVDTFNKSAELSVTHWRRELNLWRYEGTDRQTDRQTEEKGHLVDFVEVSIRAEESLIETSVRGEK